MNEARIAWWRPREWGLTLLDLLGLATRKSLDELVAETAAVEAEIKRLEGQRQQKRWYYQVATIETRVLDQRARVEELTRSEETARPERQRRLEEMKAHEEELSENLRVTKAWLEMFEKNQRRAL